MGLNQVNFFPNLPQALTSVYAEEISEFYPGLVERNYLPFARYSDWGVQCFDANIQKDGNEYPIVTFDHEDDYDSPDTANNSFLEMFAEGNAHLDEWISNYRSKNGD